MRTIPSDGYAASLRAGSHLHRLGYKTNIYEDTSIATADAEPGHATRAQDGVVETGFEHVQERSSSYKGHTANALALVSDEGRGRLRKVPGSCLASFDPGMSEWGNPLP